VLKTLLSVLNIDKSHKDGTKKVKAKLCFEVQERLRIQVHLFKIESTVWAAVPILLQMLRFRKVEGIANLKLRVGCSAQCYFVSCSLIDCSSLHPQENHPSLCIGCSDRPSSLLPHESHLLPCSAEIVCSTVDVCPQQ
jgi:hypothetical protein